MIGLGIIGGLGPKGLIMYCNTFISSGLKGKYGGIIILGGMGGNDDLTGRPYAGG